MPRAELIPAEGNAHDIHRKGIGLFCAINSASIRGIFAFRNHFYRASVFGLLLLAWAFASREVSQYVEMVSMLKVQYYGSIESSFRGHLSFADVALVKMLSLKGTTYTMI
jgi:hypothetical protein